DANKQAEVRDALPSLLTPTKSVNHRGSSSQTKNKSGVSNSEKNSIKVAIEYLLEDAELQERCKDILLARKNFDRPINQATLVLEDRIRKKASPLPKKMVGENLVSFAFNEDISKSVLKVAGGDSDDQRGFTQMLKGVVPPFRNPTHHHITKTFSRQEALRVSAFIDVLLRVVDNSTK